MKPIPAFLLLLFVSCSKVNTPETKSKIVGIQPYKGMSSAEVVTVSKTIARFYGIRTVVLPEKELPQQAFINIKSPRYRADSIIKIQNRVFPDTLDYILGLTAHDVSVTKNERDGTVKKPEWKYNDFGVMGLAYRPGKSAIVSTFRLKSNDKQIALSRFKKVAIHEFGHNLGLPHCPDRHCVMTSANEKITTIDNEKMALCLACKRKLGI